MLGQQCGFTPLYEWRCYLLDEAWLRLWLRRYVYRLWSICISLRLKSYVITISYCLAASQTVGYVVAILEWNCSRKALTTASTNFSRNVMRMNSKQFNGLQLNSIGCLQACISYMTVTSHSWLKPIAHVKLEAPFILNLIDSKQHDQYTIPKPLLCFTKVNYYPLISAVIKISQCVPFGTLGMKMKHGGCSFSAIAFGAY